MAVLPQKSPKTEERFWGCLRRSCREINFLATKSVTRCLTLRHSRMLTRPYKCPFKRTLRGMSLLNCWFRLGKAHAAHIARICAFDASTGIDEARAHDAQMHTETLPCPATTRKHIANLGWPNLVQRPQPAGTRSMPPAKSRHSAGLPMRWPRPSPTPYKTTMTSSEHIIAYPRAKVLKAVLRFLKTS